MRDEDERFFLFLFQFHLKEVHFIIFFFHLLTWNLSNLIRMTNCPPSTNFVKKKLIDNPKTNFPSRCNNLSTHSLIITNIYVILSFVFHKGMISFETIHRHRWDGKIFVRKSVFMQNTVMMLWIKRLWPTIWLFYLFTLRRRIAQNTRKFSVCIGFFFGASFIISSAYISRAGKVLYAGIRAVISRLQSRPPQKNWSVNIWFRCVSEPFYCIKS